MLEPEPYEPMSNALIELMETKLGIDKPSDMAIVCLLSGVRLLAGFQHQDSDPEIVIAAMTRLMREMLIHREKHDA